MSMTSLFISLAASGGKNFMIVGCNGGVYVGIRGEQGKSRPFIGNEVDINNFTVYRRVLNFRNAIAIFAIQKHNKILIHIDESLLSYSLDMIARASQNNTTPKALDASMEKVSGQDKVTVAKVGIVKGRSVGTHLSSSLQCVHLTHIFSDLRSKRF